MVEIEDDVENHQKDINKLDTWGKSNNMEYNASKFVVIRYGKTSILKRKLNTLVVTWMSSLKRRSLQKTWV